MKNATFLALLAALFAALPGCDETIDPEERYGQLLSPSEVEDCPDGCVPYVTMPDEQLFLLAQRAYEDGYKFYKIISLEENQERLEEATEDDGTIKGGVIIFLPPDDEGRPVRARKSWHFRGSGIR